MKMKQFVFASILVLSASAAFSQGNINQGDWLVGGNAGFSYNKEGDYKTTTVSASPNLGYFFINNFAGGLRLGVGSSKTKINSAESTNSGYHVGPFVRYYFLPSSQKMNFFADGMFAFGQNKYESNNTTTKNNFTTVGFMAGPAFFLTPSTALEFALQYSSDKYKDVKDRSNTFGLEIGFQVHLAGAKKK